MIILALGSNLDSVFGNRFININLALSYLQKYGIKILKKSNFYETPSYPDKSKPKFLNIVISAETVLPPVDLMSVLIFIEEKLGRERKIKNDPRTCDIDIIDYKSQIIDFNYNNISLSVPHKKLSSRNFVLFPLKEIQPSWTHPITKEIIDVLIKNLPEDEKKSILKVE